MTKIPAYAKTAIARKKLSSPAEYLNDQRLIVGKALDFGCGRGYDADYLDMIKYDPWWFPNPCILTYDTILCTYVLNTIESETIREGIVHQIYQCLKQGGKAYMSVRTDSDLKHGYTKNGAWQGLCQELDKNPLLTLIKTHRRYKMYIAVKE